MGSVTKTELKIPRNIIFCLFGFNLALFIGFESQTNLRGHQNSVRVTVWSIIEEWSGCGVLHFPCLSLVPISVLQKQILKICLTGTEITIFLVRIMKNFSTTLEG